MCYIYCNSATTWESFLYSRENKLMLLGKMLLVIWCFTLMHGNLIMHACIAHFLPGTALVIGYLATPPGMAPVSCKKSGEGRLRVTSHHLAPFSPLLIISILLSSSSSSPPSVFSYVLGLVEFVKA